MHFLVPRVLQKKQPHRQQEVLLQHPLHPQLNVEVGYHGRPLLLKWLFFLKAVVYTRCAQHWVGGQGGANSSIKPCMCGWLFFLKNPVAKLRNPPNNKRLRGLLLGVCPFWGSHSWVMPSSIWSFTAFQGAWVKQTPAGAPPPSRQLTPGQNVTLPATQKRERSDVLWKRWWYLRAWHMNTNESWSSYAVFYRRLFRHCLRGKL